MGEFKLIAPFEPQGDQPQATAKLWEGLNKGYKYQTLLGVTGSGKTYSMAVVIEGYQKPTLVMAPNKILAAQLCNEFKEFFPGNAVEYFVSYYDYYQPEAYIPQTDTYIEKDSSINAEIEKLRYSATDALFSRNDVIIVASVSCIYSLGSPEEYKGQRVVLEVGRSYDRQELFSSLVKVQYERNEIDFSRGKFRAKGDTVDIFPAYRDTAIRVDFWGDEVDRILEIDPLTGEVLGSMDSVLISPATHFLTAEDSLEAAIHDIEVELEERLQELKSQDKLLEAQRLEMRTRYDLEMLREVGFCQGIENYSRHLTRRKPGETPQPSTQSTGSMRTVEREHAGRKLLEAHSTVYAGKMLREGQRIAVHHIDVDDSPSRLQRSFHRLKESGFYAPLHGQSVHDYLDIVFNILVQGHLLFDIVDFAIHPYPGITLPPHLIEQVLILPFSSPDHRSQNLKPGSVRESEDLIHDLFHALPGNGLATDVAVRFAYPGVKETEVVVDLGHSAHGGTRIFGGPFLIDGYGWREATYVIHIRLFHLAQKLTGIGGEGLHVSPLTFGIDGIESQGGLA